MWPFSEMSLPTASLIGTIANWVLLASLLGGVLSTFVIVKTADVKEEHWAEDRRHSSELIVALTTQGDQLRKDTAEANARAVEAQLALEKFKAGRVLSQGQMELIARALPRLEMNTISVHPVPVTFETARFAEQVAQILILAGFKPRIFHGDAARVASGVIVQHVTGNDSSTKLAESFVTALNAEQIDAQMTGGLHELAYGPPSYLDRTGDGSRNIMIFVGENPR